MKIIWCPALSYTDRERIEDMKLGDPFPDDILDKIARYYRAQSAVDGSRSPSRPGASTVA